MYAQLMADGADDAIRLAAASLHDALQPLDAALRPVRAELFHDAVSIHHKRLARVDVDFRFIPLSLIEQTERHAACIFEPPDRSAGPRVFDDGRIVAGTGIGQLARSRLVN